MPEIPTVGVISAEVPAQSVDLLPNRPHKPDLQDQLVDPSLPSVTTFQEDLTTAGQRRINLIWEYTQAAIAILVVVTTMICGGIGMYRDAQIPTIISVAFGMITGFYFSRTNHAAIGGVGKKAEAKYEGR